MANNEKRQNFVVGLLVILFLGPCFFYTFDDELAYALGASWIGNIPFNAAVFVSIFTWIFLFSVSKDK